MNVRNAAWALARRWRSGVEGLCDRMLWSASTRGKELAGAPGYKLGIETCVEITQAALADGIEDPLAILNAFALSVGAVVIPLPQQLDDYGTTFKCLADAAHEFGVFMAKAAEAMADGKITENELREVEREYGLLMARGQSCLASMRAVHEAGRPVALRDVKAA
jgi:hypothetical protein